MKWNFNGPCPVCGKPRGTPKVSHGKCGKILQERHKAKMAEPYTFPDGKQTTVEAHKAHVSRRVAKRYSTGKVGAFWKGFD